VARSFLDTYAKGGEVEGGWLYAKALKQAQLDYSDRSLLVLDKLLAAIRERGKPTREALQGTQPGRNFCSLLAFYLYEMVRRKSGVNFDWHDRESALSVLPEGTQLPDEPGSRLVAVSYDAAIMPLSWIEAQVLGEDQVRTAADFVGNVIAHMKRNGSIDWGSGMYAVGRIASWQMMMAADGGSVLPVMLSSNAPGTWKQLVTGSMGEDVNKAIERGLSMMEENAEGASWQVLSYNGLFGDNGMLQDAVMVLLYTYGESPLRLRIAFPYRPAQDGRPFAILGPMLDQSNVEHERLSLLNHSLDFGIQSVKWAFGKAWNQLREAAGAGGGNASGGEAGAQQVVPVTAEHAERLRKSAESARSFMMEQSIVELNYDLEGVRWLTDYIDRVRLMHDAQGRQEITNMLGAFLGECFIRNVGGQWAIYDNMLIVSFGDGNGVFPFNKVGKQMEAGTEGGESVLGMYDGTLAMRSASRPPSAMQQRMLEFYERGGNHIFIPSKMDGTVKWVEIKGIKDGWVTTQQMTSTDPAISVPLTQIGSFYVTGPDGKMIHQEPAQGA